MHKSILIVLLMTIFTSGCLQELKKPSPSEAELKFPETLIANFSDEEFLKEEDRFSAVYIGTAKRAPETYRDLGIALYKAQNLAGAITVFQRLAEVYPSNEDVMGTLATLHEENRDKNAAIESYKLALALAEETDGIYADYYQSEIARLQRPDAKPGLDILFEDGQFQFASDEKQLIESIVVDAEKSVRALLPGLTEDIRLIVTIVDRNLDVAEGVSGRAETHNPGEVMIEISNVFPGGVNQAVKTSLASTVFHELHHVYRGWAIRDNKFGRGISIAMVNEGLAVAFSEIYTGNITAANSYTDDADDWVKEIILLPVDADYAQWVMGEHPDGRTSIAYRAGNYLIHEVIAKTGKNILELSELSPDEILKLGGY